MTVLFTGSDSTTSGPPSMRKTWCWSEITAVIPSVLRLSWNSD